MATLMPLGTVLPPIVHSSWEGVVLGCVCLVAQCTGSKRQRRRLDTVTTTNDMNITANDYMYTIDGLSVIQSSERGSLLHMNGCLASPTSETSQDQYKSQVTL